VFSRWRLWAIAAAAVVVLTVLALHGTRAAACALDPRRPQSYEADANRAVYSVAIDAASQNALFPGDPYFGLPKVRTGTRSARVDGPPVLPAVLMKAIGWIASDLTMASRSVQF